MAFDVAGHPATRAAAVGLSLVLHAALAHSIIFYAIFVLSKGSWSPLPTIKTADGKDAQLVYEAQLPRVSAKLASRGTILSSRDIQQIVGNWMMVLVAAILTILMFQLKNVLAVRKHPTLLRVRRQMSRFLRYQLPPYRFWVWWCGGLDIKDLFLVLIYLTYNFYWVYSKAESRSQSIPASQEAGKMTSRQGRLIMMKQIGASLGAVSMFSMALLFFPVPRNTFLHHVFNTDFSGLLKYHRWLGYGLIYTIILHSLIFYAYWVQIDESFSSNFFKWGPGKVNNLAGTISTFSGVLVLATSMLWVRRLYFQVFIRCHIIGFLGFTSFAYIHFWQRWETQTPGLILMLLDWVFRINQWLHPSYVTGVLGAADKSVITLEMKWRKAAKPRAGEYVFLNSPASGKRRFQWHPITIADVDASRPDVTLVKAHMKCYGAWTKSLIAEMLEKGHALMRADGPYGVPSGPGWQNYDVLVIIAGGIGATPMLGMLRDIAAQRKKHVALGEKLIAGFPKKIIMHWSSRGEAEFPLLDAHLVKICMEDDSWLQIELYSTSQPGETRDVYWNEEEVLMETNKHGEIELSKVADVPTEPQIVRAAIPLGSTQAFEPYVGSNFSWMWCHILAFVGAFFALLMGKVYETNLQLTGTAVSADGRTGTWILVASFVGSMGLPALYIVLVKVVNCLWAHRQWKQRPDLRTQEGLEAANEEEVSLAPSYPPYRSHIADSLSGLQVRSGRPNVRSILTQTVADYRAVDCIGVFVAGPTSMIRDVKCECAGYNAAWRSPHLDFQSHAFEL